MQWGNEISRKNNEISHQSFREGEKLEARTSWKNLNFKERERNFVPLKSIIKETAKRSSN